MGDESLAWALRVRGVDNPCSACMGMGVRRYSSGSTWRGGMGTASYAHDVCDQCWGSGDADKPWTNIREVEKQRREWEAEQCAKWLAERAGVSMCNLKDGLTHIIGAIEKEAKRRKLPAGVHAFWYARTAEIVASALRELAARR